MLRKGKGRSDSGVGKLTIAQAISWVLVSANVIVFFLSFFFLKDAITLNHEATKFVIQKNDGFNNEKGTVFHVDGPLSIGYSVTAYQKFHHLKWLIEELWEQQHVFMINIDSKSSDEYYQQVVDFASQYDNIYLSKYRYDIIYYGWTAMWVELQAWLQILQNHPQVQYFINMSGQEFPIKTRCEIRTFLQKNMGKNFITIIPDNRQSALRDEWIFETWAEVGSESVKLSDVKMNRPEGINFVACYRYVMLHRDFVDYLFSDPKMLELLIYSKSSQSPDEFFIGSALMSSPFKDTLWKNNYKFATWATCCTGYIKTLGHPCILGVCHIEKLLRMEHLFINKIDADIDAEFVPQMRAILQERVHQEEQSGVCLEVPLLESRTMDSPDFRGWSGDFSAIENMPK